MQGFVDWLASLPQWALLPAMALAAALENVFPPIPADTIVALGAFLSARGEGTPQGAFLAVWLGNVAGAMGMYAAGRRFGHAFLQRWLQRSERRGRTEDRVEALYDQHGLLSLAACRLLPAVRAIVPPFAGALRLRPMAVLAVVALPSGIWYGIVTVVAYRLGSNLEGAVELVGSLQLWVVGLAAALLIVMAAAWYIRRRRRERADNGANP